MGWATWTDDWNAYQQDPEGLNYCAYNPMMTAFVLLLLKWIMIPVAIALTCCCVCCGAMCCACFKPNTEEKATLPEHKMYFKSPTYKAKTRKEKMTDLWKVLVPTFEEDEDLNDVEPKEFPWELFPNFFRQKGNGSFCQSSDEIKKNRPKTTHTQGLVAKVSWIPTTTATTKHSGMYASQQDEVTIRLSETQMLTDESSGLQPSLALKFLVDGRRSDNLFAMSGLKPTDSWDFMS